MFIDEMFEDLLVNKKMMYADAMAVVCKEKLASDKSLTAVKRIENAYQLTVKRYPALNPRAFRLYVHIKSPDLSKTLGWNKEFENGAQ